MVATAIPALEAQTPAPPPAPAIAADPGVPRTTIRVTVNGTLHRVEVEDRWTLVELLRDRLGLTGTKIGCDRGECGACTVLMDGKPVYSCSNLAVWADGKSIVDGRGPGANGRLEPLQQAFVEHDAPQCGFCTSGQLMRRQRCSTRIRIRRRSRRARDDGQSVPLRQLQPLRRSGRRGGRRPTGRRREVRDEQQANGAAPHPAANSHRASPR